MPQFSLKNTVWAQMSAFCENWIFSHGKSYWFMIFKFLVEDCFSIENDFIRSFLISCGTASCSIGILNLHYRPNLTLYLQWIFGPGVKYWSFPPILHSLFCTVETMNTKHFSNTKTQPSFPDSSNTSNPGQGITNPTFFFTSGYPIFSNLLITYESVWY